MIYDLLPTCKVYFSCKNSAFVTAKSDQEIRIRMDQHWFDSMGFRIRIRIEANADPKLWSALFSPGVQLSSSTEDSACPVISSRQPWTL